MKIWHVGSFMQDNFSFFHCEDRSEARMSSDTILIPARHRLDHEKDYIKQKKWDPVDSLEPVGRVGLCGLPRSPLPHAGKKRAAKHSLNTRTQYQWKQDKDYESHTQRTTTPSH